jgi:hypothetical protein
MAKKHVDPDPEHCLKKKINTFSTLHAGFLGVEKRKRQLTL